MLGGDTADLDQKCIGGFGRPLEECAHTTVMVISACPQIKALQNEIITTYCSVVKMICYLVIRVIEFQLLEFGNIFPAIYMQC